jgi:hypothetical protein
VQELLKALASVKQSAAPVIGAERGAREAFRDPLQKLDAAESGWSMMLNAGVATT